VSTSQEIQKEAKVEELKQPNPEELNNKELSIYEGTVVNRSRALGKVTMEFQF
jgi:hypothetical protein